MSQDSRTLFAIASALVTVGGSMALFPKCSFFQVNRFGKKLGGAPPDTRVFGTILFLFGLIIFAIQFLVSR